MEQHQKKPALRRSLQSRHLSMLAIGGSIGTGLFLASGATVATAGPGGALLAYSIMGLMVYFLMTGLGEMTALMPVSGSFQVYGSQFVDPAFGFALGWNYWYNWAVTIAVELAAASIIMHYWFPSMPGWLWSGIFLAIIVCLNVFSVRGFGEAEYGCAMFKVMTIVAFIVIGFSMILGIMTTDPIEGFRPGLEVFEASGSSFIGGFAGFVGVSMMVGFAFQGTELIGVAAGEADNPGKTIPRAVRHIFWRILMFYMLSIVVIGCILPYNDPSLLKNGVKDIAASPFTLVFERAGLAFAASIINATILSAVVSAGNSGMYASTRMLYTMAQNGMAPRLFAKLSKNGVPRNALYATTLIAGLCFLSSLFNNNDVYLWLLNSSGMTGFIAWLGIAICHFRFRRALISQGYDIHSLPYRAKWFPFGPLFAFALCLIVMLGQNYAAFMGAKVDWHGVVASYIGIPLFIVFWWTYKWRHKTKWIALKDIDLKRGRLIPHEDPPELVFPPQSAPEGLGQR